MILLEKFGAENEPAFPAPNPIEALKFRMEQMKMRNKDLSEIVGSKSKASEILNKKRRLTLSMIRKINKKFGIPAETLIQEYDLAM